MIRDDLTACWLMICLISVHVLVMGGSGDIIGSRSGIGLRYLDKTVGFGGKLPARFSFQFDEAL